MRDVRGTSEVSEVLHREWRRRSEGELVGVLLEHRVSLVWRRLTLEDAVECLPIHQPQVVLDDCGNVLCLSHKLW